MEKKSIKKIWIRHERDAMFLQNQIEEETDENDPTATQRLNVATLDAAIKKKKKKQNKQNSNDIIIKPH